MYTSLQEPSKSGSLAYRTIVLLLSGKQTDLVTFNEGDHYLLARLIYNLIVYLDSVDAALPALNELRVLMEGQLDPAQEIEPSTAAPEKGKKKLTPNWPSILFAVVDSGQVSFVNIFNIKALPQLL